MLPRRALPEPKIDATNVGVFIKRGTQKPPKTDGISRATLRRLVPCRRSCWSRLAGLSSEPTVSDRKAWRTPPRLSVNNGPVPLLAEPCADGHQPRESIQGLVGRPTQP